MTRHLVFLPESARGPAFFLWPAGADRPAAGAVERLEAAGQDARARVVTERLSVATVRGRRIPLLDAVAILAGIDAADLDRLPASVAAWSLAAKLALDLVARERILPLARPCPGGATVRWGVSLAHAGDGERFSRLARALPVSAHAVPIDAETLSAPDALLGEFLDATADALARKAAVSSTPSTARPAATPWEARWVSALTAPDPPARVLADDFVERALLQDLDDWVAPARGAAATRSPRLCFKLDPPGAAWTLDYLLQAPDDPSLLVPAGRVWNATGKHLSWMDRSFDAPQETLLRGLAQASHLFSPIERSLEAPRPESARLTDEEAWGFLSEAAPALAEAGFAVHLPAELTAAGQRRLRLRLRAGGSKSGVAGAVAAGERLSLDALVEYRWELALGDQPLSPKDFRALTALKRPLVRWRGQWLVLDPNEVAGVERLLQPASDRRIRLRDVLAAALTETSPREGLAMPAEVVPEGGLAAALERLRAEPDRVAPPAELAGTLRPYQERGLAWLGLMAGLGLGGCLA